jgi:tetratricopeptide (TPR) repeat protein
MTGCARHAGEAPVRLAVAEFENLGSNLELDWMRRGLSSAVVSDLAGSPAIYAQVVDSVNSAYTMQATRVLEGYFYENGGRLEIRATVEELGTRTAAGNFEVSGPAAQGPLPLVNELAKKVSAGARSFQTTNASAFRDYGQALGASDRADALRGLELATKEDPNFSLAFLDWARVLAGMGDRQGALKVIEAAQAAKPDPIAGAELESLAATARGDAAARQNALESLSHLTPADAKVFRGLAELQIAERKFPEAVRSYETVARLTPDEASVWNELGYGLAYTNDLTGARRALEKYQKLLPPENVNWLDSLGEVSFYLGDFGGAAKYFLEADQKNRGEFGGTELVKAAQARILAGDLKEGDAVYQKYVGLIEGGQRGRAAYQLAQWQFLTGRRKVAMAGLEKIIPGLDADGQALRLSQLSFWRMQTGDAKTAADLANQAAARAVSPLARNLSAICRVIATPTGSPSGSPVADALTLLFARRFTEATPLLERLYRETNPARDGQIRTLLAWAYVETNRTADADRLVGNYPLPLSVGESEFASLVFPRYLFVRGVVLQHQGKQADAKAAYELFLKYAGDVPDIFGDDTVARKNLSAL